MHRAVFIKPEAGDVKVTLGPEELDEVSVAPAAITFFLSHDTPTASAMGPRAGPEAGRYRRRGDQPFF